MFPLPILTYVKAVLFAILLCSCGYAGWHIRDVDFMEYKAKQQELTQTLQEEHQAAADQIRKDKDAQIASINSSLADALVQLRSRPSRAQGATNGQGGTGLSLSAEDATFLEREAARADILRTALDACYKQYDSLSIK
jgi:hypothetical protein